MHICTVVKLQTSAQEHAALVETLRVCNAASDAISAVAFQSRTFRKYDLQPVVYHQIKEATSLVSNHVIRAIAKVADAYKLDTKTLRTFNPLGAIELDKDLLTWKVQEQIVSVSTLQGRVRLHFDCSADQKELLLGKRAQADLLLREGTFYLSVAVTIAEAPLYEAQGAIGVDVGIVNVATDSEGNRYTGEVVKAVRRKYRAFRQEVQPKKTRSARKRMAKKRRKESRFVRDVNHCVSKSLVRRALNRQKALVVEALKGIRERGNRLKRGMRTELNQWAFAQLKNFLAYKCKRAGVPLIEVDARYSSQQCSRCAHTERANRPNQETFRCRFCCFQAHADVNAAKVLEARVVFSTGPRFHLAAAR